MDDLKAKQRSNRRKMSLNYHRRRYDFFSRPRPRNFGQNQNFHAVSDHLVKTVTKMNN